MILGHDVCGSCSGAVSAGSRMTDAAGWAACAAPCTRAATHRILASHTEWMLGSPPCACMASRIAANPRHWKAESAASALECGRSDRPESGKGVRAKFAAQRMHSQLTVGLALTVPLPHREIRLFSSGLARHVASRATTTTTSWVPAACLADVSGRRPLAGPSPRPQTPDRSVRAGRRPAAARRRAPAARSPEHPACRARRARRPANPADPPSGNAQSEACASTTPSATQVSRDDESSARTQ